MQNGTESIECTMIVSGKSSMIGLCGHVVNTLCNIQAGICKSVKVHVWKVTRKLKVLTLQASVFSEIAAMQKPLNG